MAKFTSTNKEQETDNAFYYEHGRRSRERGVAPALQDKLKPKNSTGSSKAQLPAEFRLLQAAFKEVSDAIMIVDGGCRVVEFNHASEELTGWSRSQAQGRNCWEVYSCGGSRHTIQGACPHNLASDTVVFDSSIEHELAQNGSGKIKVKMTHRTFRLHADGERYQIIVVRRDPTPGASQVLDPDILGAISHEVLSPLGLIRSYAATLLQLDETLEPEQKRRYIRAIETATFRACQSARNLLSLPSLEAMSLHLVKQRISLTTLARRLLTEIQTQSPNHVITLRTSQELTLANIDCIKIEQVFVNLLLNAVKYSPQGGDVEVTIGQADNDEDLRSMLDKGPPVRLPSIIVCVRDSGVGIPENERQLVFEKYYRVRNKLNKSVSGIGMGLYICKLIVEAHGGRIWVEQNDSGGSTFAFSLPLQ